MICERERQANVKNFRHVFYTEINDARDETHNKRDNLYVYVDKEEPLNFKTSEYPRQFVVSHPIAIA